MLPRRLSTRDKAAWDRYTCASRYECNQNECDTKVDTSDEYGVHLDDAHLNLSDDDCLSYPRIKTVLDISRMLMKNVDEEG